MILPQSAGFRDASRSPLEYRSTLCPGGRGYVIHGSHPSSVYKKTFVADFSGLTRRTTDNWRDNRAAFVWPPQGTCSGLPFHEMPS